MNLFKIIALSIFFYSSVYGQDFSGVVVDDDGFVLNNVFIKDTSNNIGTHSNSDGAFTIRLELNSVVQISLNGYQTQYRKSNQMGDTIRLYRESRVLNDVVIDYSAVKSVVVKPGINVLDYIVRPEFILVLYKEKSKKFLSIKGDRIRDLLFPLNEVDGKSLFEDCFGNIHVLTKQKAHLLTIGSQISIASEMSIDDFEKLVVPCEAVMGNNIIISSYTNHAKKYTLALKITPEKQFTPFYTIWDRETEKMATAIYWEVVGMYRAQSDTVSDIIINKMWDGKNLIELAVNPEILERVGFYEGVLAKDLNVHSFQVDEQLLTFDLCFDSLFVFNKEGDCIKKTGLSLHQKRNGQTVIRDSMRDKFYLFTTEFGVCHLSPIHLGDGHLEKAFVLTQESAAKNVKIFDNWVYFLVGENGFNKLYKVRL